MKSLNILFAFFLLLAVSMAAKPKTAAECQVCVDVITEIDQTLTDEDRKDITKIEDKISNYCSKKGLGAEKNKVCYHIDPIKREVSRPLSFKMPPEDVCLRKLNKKNSEFCGIKYYTGATKTEAPKTTDVSKMKMSQLKAILAERKVKCVGCFEKIDYVRKVKEVLANESEL